MPCRRSTCHAAIGDDSNRGNPAQAQLVFPKDHHRFALRVVIDAGGMHQRRFAEPRRFFDGFNQPPALSEMKELPWLWHGEQRHRL